ncbi:hypothetical protein BCR42DRAFT_492680 [Absidia repens]|uniref:Uncharacterized protein n=1 Tax=Absidia repens TaxID=90262 RepID=A0A1X2ICL5_9FUNG|nr:hypothetical protein BCR42DRAFT_492680 [Absidia repens]
MPSAKDELISWVIENVAMTGSKGRTMDDLWSLLTTRTSHTNSIENLWTLIISELEFTFAITTDQASSKAILTSDLENLTYEAAKTKYGSSIYLTAPLTDQTHYLLRDHQITLPTLQRTILEKIGSAGASGVAQCVITVDLDIKPQTVFHHLKKLQNLELIRKTPTIYQGQYTNTCVHTYYSESTFDVTEAPQSMGQNLTPIAPDGSIRYDATAEKMNQLLLQAKDNIMALSDLVRLTGFTSEKQLKWARTFLAKQHTEGFVEKSLATANGKKTVCIRLIKPISIADGKVDPPSNRSTGCDHEDRNDDLTPLTVDVIAAYIGSRNGNGCTNKDLYEAFPNNSKSTISNLVKKLKASNNSDLVVIKELQGRSHVYCYFTKDGFQQYQRMKSGSYEMASSTEQLNDPVTSDDGGNILELSSSAPSTARKRRLTSPPLSIESTLKRNKMNTATRDSTNSMHTNNLLPSANVNVNVTMTRRKTALLDIISRDRIRDFNVLLFDEIQTIDGSDKKHKLARRTAQRLVDGLEKQGLLRLIKIMPKDIFGGNQPRTLVLSPELDESHQAVKDYLEHKQQDAAMGTGRQISSSKGSSSESPLKRIDTLVKRYGHGRHTDTVSCSESYWRYVAKRHGWMESKWLRSKELHLFLVKLLLQMHGGILENEEQRTIGLMDMITKMPFDVYKKAIGIHQYDETVETYVETNQVPTVPLADIPDDIKRRLIPNPYQMRRRIQSLLTILEKLELIQSSTPAPATQNGSKSSLLSLPMAASTKISYTLQLNGAIRNYLLTDRPILVEKPLTSLDAVVDYWNELQYTCACVYGTESDHGTATTSSASSPPATTTTTGFKKKNDTDPLSTITLSRTWTNGDIITAEQKRCLDQHVNYSLGQVPPATTEWALFLQLSRATGLLPYRIRSYYLNLGNAFAKRNRLEQQQIAAEELEESIGQSSGKRKRQPQPLSGTTSLLLQASKENQRISQVPDSIRCQSASFSTPTFIGSRLFRRKYVKSLDDSTARKDHATGQRTIQRFTSFEKSTFLYAMAIMRHRAYQGNKFYWAPMTEVIPTKSIRQCTSHLHSLSAKSLRTIDDLQTKWTSIYTRGIESKEITDERPWDSKNFDLVGHLKYFLAQSLLEEERPPTIKPTVSLLFHPSTLHSICTVTPLSPLADNFGWSDGTASHTMGSVPGTDQISDEKGNALVSTIQLIKMIMVHPEETFDSHLAYSLLSSCSADAVEEAYLYLKDAGIVVLSKHGDTRRVPGRKFRMSNKFILSLAGPVSREMYDAAFDFHHRIGNGQQLPNQLDDGMMMCILNLISQQKITLHNQATDLLTQSLSSLNYPNPNRFHGKFIEQWINKRTDMCIQTDEATSLATELPITTKRIKQSIEMISTLEAQRYLNKSPLRSDRHVMPVYDALDEFGTNGASSMDLKAKLQSLRIPMSDQDLLAALRRLMCHTPSLVVQAGYGDLRYFCVPHAKSWMIKIPTTSDTEAGMDTYVQTNMWTHLNGTTNQNMVYVCGSSLLGHILTKPGITQDELELIFYDTMSKAECQQVLGLLLEHEIIYCRSTLKQQPANLFSKPVLKSIDVKSTITRSATTCYFTTHDYYCKLDSLKGQ